MSCDCSSHWNEIRLWAPVILPIAALGLVVFQIVIARRINEATTLVAINKEYRELQKALLEAKGEVAPKVHFYDLLNFMEIQATALNENLYPKATRDTAGKLLRGMIALIESQEHWITLFVAAVDSPVTFEQLRIYTSVPVLTFASRCGLVLSKCQNHKEH